MEPRTMKIEAQTRRVASTYTCNATQSDKQQGRTRRVLPSKETDCAMPARKRDNEDKEEDNNDDQTMTKQPT